MRGDLCLSARFLRGEISLNPWHQAGGINASVNHDARLARADLLASRYSFAAEILRFYRHVANFQKEFFAHIAANCGSSGAPRRSSLVRDELDLTGLLPRFPAFLSIVERAAPAPLAATARNLSSGRPNDWADLLTAFWRHGCSEDDPSDASLPRGASSQFLARAFLQPYAEFLAERAEAPHLDTTPRVCPLCSAPPLLGALRPEGDGAKRSLVCSFCSHEWDFRRIFCPACGEEREDKLPVYISEQFPHIRVEACDTCKSYIRTIDLTKDGHAVPLVDDLAAVPLGLWAAEHGYSRLHPNLLGT